MAEVFYNNGTDLLEAFRKTQITAQIMDTCFVDVDNQEDYIATKLNLEFNYLAPSTSSAGETVTNPARSAYTASVKNILNGINASIRIKFDDTDHKSSMEDNARIKADVYVAADTNTGVSESLSSGIQLFTKDQYTRDDSGTDKDGGLFVPFLQTQLESGSQTTHALVNKINQVTEVKDSNDVVTTPAVAAVAAIDEDELGTGNEFATIAAVKTALCGNLTKVTADARQGLYNLAKVGSNAMESFITPKQAHALGGPESVAYGLAGASSTDNPVIPLLAKISDENGDVPTTSGKSDFVMRVFKRVKTAAVVTPAAAAVETFHLYVTNNVNIQSVLNEGLAAGAVGHITDVSDQVFTYEANNAGDAGVFIHDDASTLFSTTRASATKDFYDSTYFSISSLAGLSLGVGDILADVIGVAKNAMTTYTKVQLIEALSKTSSEKKTLDQTLSAISNLDVAAEDLTGFSVDSTSTKTAKNKALIGSITGAESFAAVIGAQDVVNRIPFSKFIGNGGVRKGLTTDAVFEQIAYVASPATFTETVGARPALVEANVNPVLTYLNSQTVQDNLSSLSWENSVVGTNSRGWTLTAETTSGSNVAIVAGDGKVSRAAALFVLTNGTTTSSGTTLQLVDPLDGVSMRGAFNYTSASGSGDMYTSYLALDALSRISTNGSFSSLAAVNALKAICTADADQTATDAKDSDAVLQQVLTNDGNLVSAAGLLTSGAATPSANDIALIQRVLLRSRVKALRSDQALFTVKNFDNMFTNVNENDIVQSSIKTSNVKNIHPAATAELTGGNNLFISAAYGHRNIANADGSSKHTEALSANTKIFDTNGRLNVDDLGSNRSGTSDDAEITVAVAEAKAATPASIAATADGLVSYVLNLILGHGTVSKKSELVKVIAITNKTIDNKRHTLTQIPTKGKIKIDVDSDGVQTINSSASGGAYIKQVEAHVGDDSGSNAPQSAFPAHPDFLNQAKSESVKVNALMLKAGLPDAIQDLSATKIDEIIEMAQTQDNDVILNVLDNNVGDIDDLIDASKDIVALALVFKFLGNNTAFSAIISSKIRKTNALSSKISATFTQDNLDKVKTGILKAMIEGNVGATFDGVVADAGYIPLGASLDYLDAKKVKDSLTLDIMSVLATDLGLTGLAIIKALGANVAQASLVVGCHMITANNADPFLGTLEQVREIANVNAAALNSIGLCTRTVSSATDYTVSASTFTFTYFLSGDIDQAKLESSGSTGLSFISTTPKVF